MRCKQVSESILIALTVPSEFDFLQSSEETQEQQKAYLHWKGYDRRLDTWVEWSKIKKYTTDVTDSDYDLESLESDGHEGIDKNYLLSHVEVTKFKSIELIRLGRYIISCWYFSPYPKYVQNSKCLYLCEYCLAFFRFESEILQHKQRCALRHPPGNEIYRHNNLSVWEVDGGLARVYCENLCYLSKLFLDHKTLKHPVNLFLFYILTEKNDYGFEIVGYFSREKYSYNNVSCILVLPQCQRKGFGQFMIAFSYLLSLRRERRGTPERPLSDLGRVSYESFWKENILRSITESNNISLNALAAELAFTIDNH
uniref:Histone acetyltransferase n=1 Tax=Dermatophagoides pteronyssinus TaxID=6956 RepID=A0A6P6YC56_DERPT|nr:putative MYST-like histone acetyltransferase 1 [Dermatophagoides pteronyssinus]